MLPSEIQYEDTGKIEYSFRKEYLTKEKINQLKEILQENFKWEDIELVSTYEDLIVLVFKGFRKDFSFPNLLDYYAIKVNLKEGSFFFKNYTFDFNMFPLPKLPKESIFKTQFGVGFYPDNENLKNIIDIYFFHKDTIFVCDFFKNQSLKSIQPSENCLSLHGITFNYASNKILKFKRYIYPSDMFLKNFEII